MQYLEKTKPTKTTTRWHFRTIRKQPPAASIEQHRQQHRHHHHQHQLNLKVQTKTNIKPQLPLLPKKPKHIFSHTNICVYVCLSVCKHKYQFMQTQFTADSVLHYDRLSLWSVCFVCCFCSRLFRIRGLVFWMRLVWSNIGNISL